MLDAVAQAAKWKPRKRRFEPFRTRRSSTGRGIGLGTHLTSYGGAVAEIEVEQGNGPGRRETHVRRDRRRPGRESRLCRKPDQRQLVQTASRMLKEEVTFNKTNVTSLDWNSYPILRFEECPAVTPIVVQRLDQPSTGAGEEVMAPRRRPSPTLSSTPRACGCGNSR